MLAVFPSRGPVRTTRILSSHLRGVDVGWAEGGEWVTGFFGRLFYGYFVELSALKL